MEHTSEMNLQVEATARALAIQCGAISVAEVVAWADTVILDQAECDPRLFDISLAKTNDAVLSALNAFGPPRERSRVARRAFQLFHTSLVAGRADYSRIAKALYEMAGDDYLPHPGQRSPMWAFWDTYDLAVDGIAGEVEEVKSDLLSYLHANME